MKAAPLRASPFRTQVSNDAPSRRKAPEPRKNRAEVVAKTEVEKVDYNQENWLLRKIPEVKEFLKKELLSYKPSNMPYFSFIKHRYPHWDEHLFFYKIGLKYHEGRRRVVKFFKDNIWDRNRLKKERERIVPEIDEYNFYFESIQKENDRIIYDISAGRDFINDFDVDDGRIYKCDLSNEPLTEEDVVLVVSYSPPFTFTPNSKYCHLHPGIEHDDEEKSFPKVYVKDKNDVVGGNIQTMMECALASMEEFRFYIKLKYITEESKKKLLAEKVPVGRVSPLSLHQWVITDYTVKKKEKHYIKFNEDDYRFVPKRIKTLAQKLEWINTFNERYYKSLEEMKKGEAKGLSYVKKFGIWVEFKDMCRCEFCPIDNPC